MDIWLLIEIRQKIETLEHHLQEGLQVVSDSCHKCWVSFLLPPIVLSCPISWPIFPQTYALFSYFPQQTFILAIIVYIWGNICLIMIYEIYQWLGLNNWCLMLHAENSLLSRETFHDFQKLEVLTKTSLTLKLNINTLLIS
jgi:hypothetical protein